MLNSEAKDRSAWRQLITRRQVETNVSATSLPSGIEATNSARSIASDVT